MEKKTSDPRRSNQPVVFSQIQQLHFNRSDIVLSSTPFGIRIAMKGFQVTGAPGAPALPHKIIRVALPQGHGFVRLSVKSAPSVLLNHTPEPVIAIQKPSIGGDARLPYQNFERLFTLPDEDKYLAAFKRRKKVCRFAGEEMMGLVPIALIELWPIGFTKEGLLELTEEVTLTVVSAPSEKMALRETEHRVRLTPKRIFKQHTILNEMVVNKTLVEKELRKSVAALTKELAEIPVIEEAVVTGTLKGISVPVACDYLIITDNYNWDTVLALQGSFIGDITSKFQLLAKWKKSRGLRTHVAQVTDIVGGQYGDFMTGARDLAEVIRNFLKWFCGPRGVEFVLLGGDVNIIPARRAASCAWGQIWPGDFKDKNVSTWKGTYLGMRVNTDDFNSSTNILTNFDTGVVIPYDSAGSSNTTTSGWYYTTDKTFATISPTATEWVRVNEPSSKVNATMVWYTEMNLIPTDFYYASLYGAGYSVPGKHDWDYLNNKLYGQHNATKNFDNVEYHTDVSIGRASVETVAEAEAFINKVLEYEKWGSVPRPDSDFDRFRSMLFAASTWGPFIRIEHDAMHAVPDNNKYKPSGEYALLHCDNLPPDAGDQLICYFNDHYYRRLNYRSNAKHGNPGWYYAKAANDLTPSIFSFSMPPWFSWEFPIPTPWIVVWDGDTSVLNPMYFGLDFSGLDSSITEQESLREKMLQLFPGIDHIERLYTDEADMNPAEVAETWLRHLTAANLKDALNRGPHFVSMTGHGNWPGCAFFDPAMVNSLTNGPKTFILYADSCLTGKLDHNDCVAEVATNFANGAAVAYIGNTRFSWIGLGAIYREHFFMRMQLTRHLGEMNDSRLELLAGTTGGERIARIWYCYNTHLFGDPEMPVYRDVAESKNYFIGNWNTDELHDCRCQWVDRMTPNHKVHFATLQAGLNVGYDGCGFCLRKYHTK